MTAPTPEQLIYWALSLANNAGYQAGYNAALEAAARIAAQTCHHEATDFGNGFNTAALSIEHQILEMKQ